MESSVDERLLLIALLEELVGTWYDTKGSVYELSLDSPPCALTVRTIRSDGTSRSTKGLIQLRLGEPKFYYICWGQAYVLDGSLLKLPVDSITWNPLTWNCIEGSGVPFVWFRKGETTGACGAELEQNISLQTTSAPDDHIISAGMEVDSGPSVSSAAHVELSREPSVFSSSHSPIFSQDFQYSKDPLAFLQQQVPSSSSYSTSTPTTQCLGASSTSVGREVPSSSHWPSVATQAQYVQDHETWPGEEQASNAQWPLGGTPFPENSSAFVKQEVSSSSHWPSSVTHAPDTSGQATSSIWPELDTWDNEVPYPWMECMDEAHHMPYYYNTVTGETTWQHP